MPVPGPEVRYREKTPEESAVKGDQKSFQLCSVTLLFYISTEDSEDVLYPPDLH